jgi:hypothetical protein
MSLRSIRATLAAIQRASVYAGTVMSPEDLHEFIQQFQGWPLKAGTLGRTAGGENSQAV